MLDFRDSQREVDSEGTVHTLEGTEMHTGFWQESLKERDHLEDKAVDEKITLTRIFKYNMIWVGGNDSSS
jgi:hypothetical protein